MGPQKGTRLAHVGCDSYLEGEELPRVEVAYARGQFLIAIMTELLLTS
jgi:hypothetical protein